MSSLSINHICKVKGLPRKCCDSPPINTESSPKKVSAKIREAGLSPSLTHNTYDSSIHRARPSGAKQRFSHDFRCLVQVNQIIRFMLNKSDKIFLDPIPSFQLSVPCFSSSSIGLHLL